MMKFPVEALKQHVAIVGKTGSGKTYTAKGLVEDLLRANKRVCILDPTGAWYGLRSSADGKKPGFPIAVFGGQHGDVPIAATSGAALAKILAEKNLPAIIDLSEMLIGDRHRFVTDFAETIYRENKEALELVIDEADEFIPQNPMPETRRLLHHVDRIIRRGRIKGFRVMMITQRPAVIHKNALTQANTLVVMRLTAPQDRKAIQAWIEGNASTEVGRIVLDSLASMGKGEGWIWAPELDILEKVKFPKISTFDSSRTPDENDQIAAPTRLADVDLGEIRKAFAAVEDERKTLAELQAQVAKLTRELALERKMVKPQPKPLPAAQAPRPFLRPIDVEKIVKRASLAAGKALQEVLLQFHNEPAGSRTAPPSAATTPARAAPVAERPAAGRERGGWSGIPPLRFPGEDPGRPGMVLGHRHRGAQAAAPGCRSEDDVQVQRVRKEPFHAAHARPDRIPAGQPGHADGSRGG